MCTNLPLRYSRCALFCTAHRLHFFMYVFYRFCCFSEVLMSTVPRLCSTFFKSTLSAGNHCTMYKFIRGLSTGDHVFVHCVHCKNVQRWTCSWWFSVLLNILYIATSKRMYEYVVFQASTYVQFSPGPSFLPPSPPLQSPPPPPIAIKW